MLGLNVRASQPFPAQVTALRGSTVLARFGDVWYFATVQDVRGSYEVEVLWESEYSRSIVAIQDLQPIVDPERCIAAIQPTAAVLARFGADAWHPGRVKRVSDGIVEVLWDAEFSISLLPMHDVMPREAPLSQGSANDVLARRNVADQQWNATCDRAHVPQVKMVLIPRVQPC